MRKTLDRETDNHLAVSAELVKITGCTSSRDLQEQIASERNLGTVICSGSGSGYWRAKNRQELLEFVHCMDARAKNTLAATRSTRSARGIYNRGSI